MGACGWSGVGIETKRLDALENVISNADQPEVVLSYATKVSQTLVTQKSFRQQSVGAVGEVVRNVGFRRAEL